MELKDIIKEFKNCEDLIKEGYRVLGKEMSVSFPGPSMPAKSNNQDSGIGSPYGDGAKRVNEFFSIFADKILLGPSGRTFEPKHSPYKSTIGYNPFFIPLEKLTSKSFGELLSQKTLKEIYKIEKTPEVTKFDEVSKSYNKAISETYKNYKTKLSKKDAFAVKLEKDLKSFLKANDYVFNDAVFYSVFAEKNNTRDYNAWAKEDIESYKKIIKTQDMKFLSKNEIDAVNKYIFEEFLSFYFSDKSKYGYIGDIQVKIPDSMVCANSELFLNDFTLGSPPDMYSTEARNWNFRVLNPEYLFNKDGSLGKGGELLYKIFSNSVRINKAGVRIDHFIGMVNPYVISNTSKYENGRLYSSYNHPFLARFAKYSVSEFSNITKDIILRAAKENGLDYNDIYIEDLGNRPEELDPVIDECKLGRMAISQFVKIDDENHMYRLKNVRYRDLAVMDTHDSASVYGFFEEMDVDTRRKHACVLANDLRWNYTDDLLSVESLARMKWAELFTCSSKRVQSFFTSITGQSGRYNKPGYPIKWVLRCNNNFEELYLKNLYYNKAFNPFDAISLAIYARGDDFYRQNENLVHRLRAKEEQIKSLIKDNLID